jgi:hypothetical protein
MNMHPIRANLLRLSLPLALLSGGSACSHRGPAAHVAGGVARYDGPVYAGHFFHSWEGGGVFIPCPANEAERRRPPRAWIRLSPARLRWPPGASPDRSREGAETFVLITDLGPYPPGTPQDTAYVPLTATVIALRRPTPGDCPL